MKRRRSEFLTPLRSYGDGRFGFDEYWTTGRRVQVRRLTEAEAKQAYDDLTALISSGRKDLAGVSPVQWAEFRQWQEQTHSNITIREAITAMMAEKTTRKRGKQKWLRILGVYLARLESVWGNHKASELARNRSELEQWMVGLRLQPHAWNHLRGAIVQLFRWLRAKEYLPDKQTGPEKIERLDVPRKKSISHWEPQQLQLILETASPDDRVWYLLTCFGGLRTEELMPEYDDKDRVRWEDLDWSDWLLYVRPEVSKTGEDRIISIPPQLRLWLAPYRGRRGPCMRKGRRPEDITKLMRRRTGLKHAPNINRHSCGIYTRMETGSVSATAEFMGTSEGRIKTNYSRPKNPAALAKWKAILPRDMSKVVDMALSMGETPTPLPAPGLVRDDQHQAAGKLADG